MALVKCPDCGKMVSPRAAVCPDCGCPAEFFEAITESAENKEEELVAEEEADEKLTNELVSHEDMIESEEKQSEEIKVMDEFSLLGKNLCYPMNEGVYILAMKLHNKGASKVEKEIKKQYRDAKDIDKVWDEIIPSTQRAIDKVVNENVGALYQKNIYITEEAFKRKYDINLNMYLKEMMDSYDEIIDAANQLQQARQYERAGRSKWQGGGFGISGAIKGAVKAGAMNAVTGAGRAIGDSVVNSNDNANLKKAKQSMYENPKYLDSICYGFRRCIAKADIGLAEMFVDNGRNLQRVYIDFNEAVQKFDAATKYEKDSYGLAQKALDVIQMYPLCSYFYKPVMEEVFQNKEDEIDELLRFIKFWNMDEDFSDFATEVEKRTLVNDYFQEHPEVLELDFSDYSPDTYVKLKKVRHELNQIIEDGKLPSIVPFCVSLKEFFNKCLDMENCLNTVNVMDGISEEISASDFLNKIHDEKQELPGLLKDIWVRGDEKEIPESKIKSKWGLPQGETIYMYQNSAVFGTAFGGKGFVLTDSLLCDLASKAIISWNQMKEINYDSGNNKITVYDGNQLISIDVHSEKPAARRFLYVCLKEFAEHFSGESQMPVNDLPLGEDAKIYCVNCGKQISKDARFCTFCGAENAYFAETGNPNAGEESENGNIGSYVSSNSQSDDIVKAIQYYRKQMGAGLKEATDMVKGILKKK